MTSPLFVDVLGWAATTVFVGSYLFKRDDYLVRMQMVGAIMWIAYGVLMRAAPVVAANALVFTAAAWKLWRARRAQTSAS